MRTPLFLWLCYVLIPIVLFHFFGLRAVCSGAQAWGLVIAAGFTLDALARSRVSCRGPKWFSCTIFKVCLAPGFGAGRSTNRICARLGGRSRSVQASPLV